VIVSVLAAMAPDRGIGIENRLPWRLSADLKRFRELTLGHHLIVGRKTFESIGRALPGRRIIIVTRNANYRCPDETAHETAHETGSCTVVHSFEGALELAGARGETEVFICGGAQIYALALDLADRLYLTFVEAQIEADTYFPEWDEREWIEKESAYLAADDKNQYPSTFKVFIRK
jgi:dihydrofolate reductase